MKRTLKYYRIIWFRHDLLAGLSVFFVALPLCLGIALASGAPLYAGILSGIIGGIIVSIFSGAQLAVSGPAAGLTTLVFSAIVSLGDYRVFLLSVIVGGLIQIVLGLLRLGTIANYFPSSVIKGMLAAIGIILISKQLPIALGYDQPDFWTSGFLKIFSNSNFFSSIHDFNQHITRGAILISAISLAVLIYLNYFVNKKFKFIPPPLVVVVLGIIFGLIFKNFSTEFSLKVTQTVSIPENIISSIVFPDFSKLFLNLDIFRYGIMIALFASLETLLCIDAIDKLDKRNQITPVNKELIAQGVGNTLCGLLGGIPITAVVVRGAANVDAGAKTKMSSITHGGFLLLAVVMIPFVLNLIPYASLSAILIITGFNLTRPKLFVNMFSLGLRQFLPFIFTIVVILLTDLLIGVSIGLLISIYFIIRNNFKAEYKISKDHNLGIDTYLIKLNSNVTFLNKVKLKKSLDNIPEYSVLQIDGSESNFIDYDILEVISQFENKAHEKHIEIKLTGIERVNVSAVH